ncbi:MAG: tRNA pseudouridine(55) synthase TruB [Planctomycetales bacterium]|nr:tRNA pseudouridine(55) synthase TruB [Planctomycetales bacterium]
MHGLLNIDKPSGCTSRDVVNQVQRLLPGRGKSRPKVGHAGTLDPLAEGVLVVCVGAATRLIRLVQDMGKSYRGVFLLGMTSDTDDVEGEVTANPAATLPTREQLERAIAPMIGQVAQRPPAYSALRVQGKRAYDLARAGQHVELAPREVRIDRVAIADYRPPELTLEIDCGSGVYVRSIGRDLGEATGCGAVMSALTRTAVGVFHQETAVPASSLDSLEAVATALQPLSAAAGSLPRVALDEPALQRLAQGQLVELPAAQRCDGELAVLDEEGRLRAIAAWRGSSAIKPTINLPLS